MRARYLMAAGFAALQALTLVDGNDEDLGVTATGANSQANSYGLKAGITTFTTVAATTGARIMSDMGIGDEIFLANYGANTLLLYPPVGGNLNNAGADTAVNVTANKGARIKRLSPTVYHALIA